MNKRKPRLECPHCYAPELYNDGVKPIDELGYITRYYRCQACHGRSKTVTKPQPLPKPVPLSK